MPLDRHMPAVNQHAPEFARWWEQHGRFLCQEQSAAAGGAAASHMQMPFQAPVAMGAGQPHSGFNPQYGTGRLMAPPPHHTGESGRTPGPRM